MSPQAKQGPTVPLCTDVYSPPVLRPTWPPLLLLLQWEIRGVIRCSFTHHTPVAPGLTLAAGPFQRLLPPLPLQPRFPLPLQPRFPLRHLLRFLEALLVVAIISERFSSSLSSASSSAVYSATTDHPFAKRLAILISFCRSTRRASPSLSAALALRSR